MGVGYKICSLSPSAVAGNPDPAHFSIIKEQAVGNYLLLLVHYQGCTNFDGKKLLVYRGYTNSAQLLSDLKGKLDPHFTTSGICPVARFLPTDEGWSRACFMAEVFNG